MSDKITLQSVADSFSKACGVPKKTAEQLARAFFDTIADSLTSDESVKIDGLGTFRIVEVASRESINVTNGERIVIAGYKKVGFTPEEGLSIDGILGEVDKVEPVNAGGTVEDEDTEEDKGFVGDADVVVKDEVDIELEKVEVPSHVEIKEDDFSGIDMLICTPESVEEIRLELIAAREEADKTIIAAKAARKEVLRLESLLDKMETCLVPESVDVAETVGEDEAKCEAETVVEEPEESVVSEVEEKNDGVVEIVPMVAETVSGHNDAIIVDIPDLNDEEEIVYNEQPKVVELDIVEDKNEEKEEETVVEESADVVAENAEEDSAGVSEENKPVEYVVAENVPVFVEEKEEDIVPREEETVEEEVEAAESVTEEGVVEEDVVDTASESSEKTPKEEVQECLASTPAKKTVKKKEPNVFLWIAIPLVAVLLIACAMIGYMYISNQEEKDLKELPVKPKNNEPVSMVQTKTPVQKLDSVSEALRASTPEQKDLSEAGDKEAAEKSAKGQLKAKDGAQNKPKTYVLKAGETLTGVSRAFYNTNDSVKAIIKRNNFKEPDKIPSGTTIILP